MTLISSKMKILCNIYLKFCILLLINKLKFFCIDEIIKNNKSINLKKLNY